MEGSSLLSTMNDDVALHVISVLVPCMYIACITQVTTGAKNQKKQQASEWMDLHDDSARLRNVRGDGLVRQNESSVDKLLVFDLHVLAHDRNALNTTLAKHKRLEPPHPSSFASVQLIRTQRPIVDPQPIMLDWIQEFERTVTSRRSVVRLRRTPA